LGWLRHCSQNEPSKTLSGGEATRCVSDAQNRAESFVYLLIPYVYGPLLPYGCVRFDQHPMARIAKIQHEKFVVIHFTEATHSLVRVSAPNVCASCRPRASKLQPGGQTRPAKPFYLANNEKIMYLQ